MKWSASSQASWAEDQCSWFDVDARRALISSEFGRRRALMVAA
jgi:hypothetical protein